MFLRGDLKLQFGGKGLVTVNVHLIKFTIYDLMFTLTCVNLIILTI